MSLRLKPDQIGRGDKIALTATQINRLKRASAEKRGVDFSLSMAQIAKNYRPDGNLFTTALSLTRSLLPPAAKSAAKVLAIEVSVLKSF